MYAPKYFASLRVIKDSVPCDLTRVSESRIMNQ